MTECRHCAAYKAIYPPRGGCPLCWAKWFLTNPGAFAAVRTMVSTYGEDKARAQVGDKYMKYYTLWEERLKVKE